MSSDFNKNLDERQLIVKNTIRSSLLKDQIVFEPSKLLNKEILFADKLSPLDCLDIILSQKTQHCVQNSLEPLDNKCQFLNKIYVDKLDFFSPQFDVIQGSTCTIDFNDASSRDDLIKKALSQLGLNADSQKLAGICQTLEELIMNAQVDAKKLSKKEVLDHSKLMINVSNQLIAISIIDFYGTLDCYKLLKHIQSALTLGFDKAMSKNSIGAGLGSALVYEHCDSLIMGSVPNEVTRVTVVLPLAVSEKKKQFIQKSIHIITASERG